MGILLDLGFFQVYMNYVNLIVNLILPMLLLGVLNCLVYKALKKNIGPNLSIRRNRGKHEDALRKRDIRLTRIAIIIVCVFICCHLPRFVPNVVEMFMPQLSEVRFFSKIRKNRSFQSR